MFRAARRTPPPTSSTNEARFSQGPDSGRQSASGSSANRRQAASTSQQGDASWRRSGEPSDQINSDPQSGVYAIGHTASAQSGTTETSQHLPQILSHLTTIVSRYDPAATIQATLENLKDVMTQSSVANSHLAGQNLPKSFSMFRGGQTGPEIRDWIDRANTVMASSLTDMEKIVMLTAKIEKNEATKFVCDHQWDGTYKEFCDWLIAIFKGARQKVTLSNWARVTRQPYTNFADWQKKNPVLVNLAIKKWPTLTATEREVVMEGLARICPPFVMMNWGSATAFDQQKLMAITYFSEVLNTLADDSDTNKDRWASFDRQELLRLPGEGSGIHHIHTDSQRHTETRGRGNRGRFQRGRGRGQTSLSTSSQANAHPGTHSANANSNQQAVSSIRFTQGAKPNSNDASTGRIWCPYHKKELNHTPRMCILNPDYCQWHERQAAHTSQECSLNPANQGRQVAQPQNPGSNRGRGASRGQYSGNRGRYANGGQNQGGNTSGNTSGTPSGAQQHNAVVQNQGRGRGQRGNRGSSSSYRGRGRGSNNNRTVNTMADNNQNFMEGPNQDTQQLGLLSTNGYP